MRSVPHTSWANIVEIEVTRRNPDDRGSDGEQAVTQRTAKRKKTSSTRKSRREEDIVTVWSSGWITEFFYIDLGRVEALLPLSETMPGERFKQGGPVKTYITG